MIPEYCKGCTYEGQAHIYCDGCSKGSDYIKYGFATDFEDVGKHYHNCVKKCNIIDINDISEKISEDTGISTSDIIEALKNSEASNNHWVHYTKDDFEELAYGYFDEESIYYEKAMNAWVPVYKWFIEAIEAGTIPEDFYLLIWW